MMIIRFDTYVLRFAVEKAAVLVKLTSCSTPVSQQPEPEIVVVTPDIDVRIVGYKEAGHYIPKSEVGYTSSLARRTPNDVW
jgi:hypothetical protein